MSDSHPYPAPSFRGRGRGRGRSQAVRAHVARLAQQRKAANGRRGRQKLYDHPKPQAASERLKELKAAFSAVASAARPALEDLGDRSLGRLKSSPQAFRDVHEFQDVQKFLDNRHRQAQAAYDNHLELATRLNTYIYQESRAMTLSNFIRDCEDATDRFLDAQIRRLDLLEQLHDLDLPPNIIDDSWNFREISDERFLDVKAHVEYRTDLGTHPIYGNKVEVPCARTVTGRKVVSTSASSTSSTSMTSMASMASMASSGSHASGTSSSDSNSKPSPKRKAETEVDSQPLPKRMVGHAADEGSSSSAPRHIGGLLSAVLPPTDEAGEEEVEAEAEAEATPEEDSKVPSPSPAMAEGDEEMLEEDEQGTPAGDEEETEAVTAIRPVDVEKLPPLPTGATEPDAYGVRLINKRRTANLDVYNRIMVPSLFDFEPHEIGFRDSANDKSRGATKAKRGKYLGTPNSNTMHFDRSLWQFDATTYGDLDLDEEMVKKHCLHPKYGLFLRSSLNEEEPPRERKSGARPIVFYTPGGRTLNASRSNKIARLEDESAASAKKPVVIGSLGQFLEQEGISDADVRPSDDAIEAFRREKLKLWLGPCRPRDETDEEEEATGDEDQAVSPVAPEEHVPQTVEFDVAAANQNLSALLEAATASESVSSAAYPLPGSPPPLAPAPAPRRSTSSRPFDPVRDVFMDSSPPAVATSTNHHSPADVSSLLYIASLASDREYVSSYNQPQPVRHIPRAPPLLQHQNQNQYPPQAYQPSDPGPAEYAPRGLSMEPPSYHHHHPPQQQQQQQQQPPHLPLDRRNSYHNPETLLDPRLFGGEATGSHEGPNGYLSNGYYQQSRSFLHTALNQTAPPPPLPPQQDRYGQLPSSIYGAPSHHHTLPPPPPPPPPATHVHSMPSLDAPAPMSAQYYMSPPPPQQSQLQQVQNQQTQNQHTLPTLRQYPNSYAPPPRLQAPSHYPASGGQSPQMYAAHMNGPPPPPPLPPSAHARSSVVSDHAGNTPPPPSVLGSNIGEQGPHGSNNGNNNANNGGSNNSNNNGKYRKLEPAPMATRRSGWSSSGGGGSGVEGTTSNGMGGGSSSSNGQSHGTGHGTGSGAGSGAGAGAGVGGGAGTGASTGSGGSRAGGPPAIGSHSLTVTKELRTVPYDYEKIKDYAAVEPPPSHGPKAIRGWAHNNVRRSRGGTKHDMVSEWDKEEK